MASYFGVNNDTNLFSSMFGTNTTGSSTGSSSVLGDYAMIRSGAYKKLLKAYYAEEKKGSTASSVDTEETKAEKTALMSIQTAASNLRTAASELGEASGEDRLEKAKSFVSAYNTLLDSTEDVDNTRILQKTLWMIGDFKASDGLLADVGITIKDDNKLALNEEKFKAAESGTLDVLFSGRNSLTGKAEKRSFDIVNRAKEAVTKLKGGSVYTDKGDYTKLNTSTLYDKLF